MCNLPEAILAQVRADLPVYEIKPQLRERDGETAHTGLYELLEVQPDGARRVVATGGHDDCEQAQRKREKPVHQIFHLPREADMALDAYLEARKGRGDVVTKQAVLSGLVEGLLADPEAVALVVTFLGTK